MLVIYKDRSRMHGQQNIKLYQSTLSIGGDTVVKALCYKSEGLWFDSSCCHWNFSLT